MKKINKFKKLKGFLAYFLILSLVMSLSFPMTKEVKAEETYSSDKFQKLEELLKDKKDKYDVLIKCEPVGINTVAMELKDIAADSQTEVLSILNRGRIEGRVLEVESFYIANGVHAVVTDVEILREIIKLPTVKSITNNGRIYEIKPIKNVKGQSRKSVIFVPDEREIEWGVSQVHADKVWEEFNVSGAGITVGIIDTGVNYRLPALKNAYKGYNKETDTFDTQYYKDFVDGLMEPAASPVNDHGSHVAGTICGREGDNLNQIGVAPGAKFISARAIGDKGGATADLLAAAQWMLDKKPDIINNSWGGDADNNEWFVEVAKTWRDNGILAVFAAGNQAAGEPVPGLGTIANPGNMPNVFAVGANDINKKLGTFSKKGPSAFESIKDKIKPDVVAPGVQVRSVDASGNYVSWNGTSMAAPHVAGVAALIKSADKSLTPEQIEELMIKTAEPLTDTKFDKAPNMAYGNGLVNAYDAIAVMKGREMGSITGHVFKSGKDERKAEIAITSQDSAYVGRDYKVSAKIDDDIAVKSVKLLYKSADETEFKEKDMLLESGDRKSGVYGIAIPGASLKAGGLNIKIKAVDFADNETEAEKTVAVKGGITLPWSWDFESGADGFILENRWKVTNKPSAGEPPMQNGSTAYVGIDAGRSVFEKNISSYLYLPPLDLSTVSEKKIALTLDEYKGFTGITVAKIEASTDGKKWDLIHNVELRPDITLDQRKWENNSYDLSKYKGQSAPLLIRFYFHGHDADQGCGWYLDNIKLDYGTAKKPPKVIELKGEYGAKGFKLSFRMLEETDIESYIIERKTENGEFARIKELNKNELIREFINNGTGKTHWRVNYYDDSVEAGKTYIYRVRAISVFGNEGENSKELTAVIGTDKIRYKYNFDTDDNGFSTESLNNIPSDWEWGTPKRPNPMPSGFNMRSVWDGMDREGKAVLTGMWGTKIQGIFSRNQNTCLNMPEFTVESGDYIYIDSFSTLNAVSPNKCDVEISDTEKNEWQTLFGSDVIQNAKSQNEWQTLKKSLSEYEGKKVKIRFHFKTGGGIISDYELGWYIDNVSVEPERKHFEETALLKKKTENVRIQTMNVNSALFGFNSGEPVNITGVPVLAKIMILETGKYTYADLRDGSFKIPHSVNAAGNHYTLKITAKGYEPIEKKIDISNTKNFNEDFLLKEAKKAILGGRVVDENGSPVAEAFVRVVGEDEILPVQTGADGSFKFSEIYTGEYTLRAFKNNYISSEIKAVVEADKENKTEDLKLIAINRKKEEKKDYGFKIFADPAKGYQTTHFIGSMKGNAVRFQSGYKGGMLKEIEIFLVNNKIYSGSHIQVAVLGYNKHGRLYELIPFKQVKDPRPNEWNKIDVSEYTIRTDDPVYVATRYEKNVDESMGVFYDINASEKAIKRSFIYDGSFIKTTVMPAKGAYAMKTTWLYDENAEVNPESDITEGSSKDENDIKITEGEEVFTFDAATGTITAYTGRSTQVEVPAFIKNIPVKKIGERAFDGTSKDIKRKIRKLTISEGIEEIGKEAFINNNLTEILLPKSLKTIENGAFKGQYKSGLENTSLKVTMFGGVKTISESVFESAGNPLVITGMDNVESIEKNAFAGNKQIEITAPNLTKIADGAFGTPVNPAEFDYAKVYTSLNTALTSKNGEYLINPAKVTVNMIDAKDTENVLKIGLIYGDDKPQSYRRNIEADRFFKIGMQRKIDIPIIKDKTGTEYITKDNATLTLEKENNLSFYYYKKEPGLRLPILTTDKEIVGFSLPNTVINIKISDKTYKVDSNEDGLFRLSLDKEPTENAEITLSINDMLIGKLKVEKHSGSSEFITKGKKLLRYVGKAEKVIIPNSVGNGQGLEEIGDFAFYGTKLLEVTLPDSIKTIGSGAFMETGLEGFSFKNEDVNRAALRTVGEYAFRNNKLKEVKLPELAHIIQKRAFENNELESLLLGKYTGHIGDYAFTGNKLSELLIYGEIEEIGKAAFMNNRLKEVKIMPKPKERKHGLERIEELTFAENMLTTITPPPTVSYIHSTAFNKNAYGQVSVITDNSSVEPGENFYIVRKDGTILRRNNGGAGGSSGSAVLEGVPKTTEKENVKKEKPKEEKTEKTGRIAGTDNTQTRQLNWNAAKKYLKIASSLTVRVGNAGIIPADILNFIKTNKKSLILNMDNKIKWIINGKDIKKVKGSEVNFTVSMGKNKDIAGKVSAIKGLKYIGNLSFAKNVKIAAALEMNIGRKNAGLFAYLLKQDKDGYKTVLETKISKNGTVKFKLKGLEDYVLVTGKKKKYKGF